jgi:uncharacterized protein
MPISSRFRSLASLVFAVVAGALFGATALAQQPTAPPAGGAGQQQRAPQAQFAGEPRIRALMVAGGCCHDYPTQGALFMKAVQTELPVDWTYAYVGGTNGQHVPAFYTDPNWFQGYDIVVHNECFTPPDSALPTGYLDNIARATKSGIPAMVIHCAMHSFRGASSDAWRDVQGLKSMTHGRPFNIPVKIAEPEHPAMRGIPTDWVTPVDELYVIEWMRPGTLSLATAVEQANGNEYTLIWAHENQGARVFGTTLGHGMDTWHDPVFQQLLRQGFRWAAGR